MPDAIRDREPGPNAVRGRIARVTDVRIAPRRGDRAAQPRPPFSLRSSKQPLQLGLQDLAVGISRQRLGPERDLHRDLEGRQTRRHVKKQLGLLPRQQRLRK